MEENLTVNTVLQELREFRSENNKRWEQNEKCWEENDKRWKENARRWEQNDKRLESMNKKISKLEEKRETDKREILDVLDTMQKSLDKQFVDMKDYMDAQIEKFNVIHTVNDIEHKEFRQLLKAYGIRIDLQSSRISYLEKWRKQFGGDGLISIY